MRNQWRLLLLRCHSRHQLQTCRHPPLCLLQVHTRLNNSHLASFPRSPFPSPNFRFFSTSELAVEQNKDSDQILTLTDLFSTPSKSNDEVKLELASNNIVLSHDLVFTSLHSLSSSPDVCKRFFDWVFEVENEKLRSKSYNLMLGVLGGNGLVQEYWDLVGLMKKKGYGVSKSTFIRVLEKFEQEGLEGDVQKLKDLFASGLVNASVDGSVEKVCSRVCKVILRRPWGDDMEKELRELNVVFSSDLVAIALDNLGTESNKGYIFFRWIEESGLFKHDERSYNALARVLAREDYTDRFWKVIDEMRAAGYDMEKGTYVMVLNQFIGRKMVKDAVDLYEFAMGGANKPSLHDCTFLLRKIVTSKELDMNLFSKVVSVFKESANTLTDATLDAILKSLTSVGRYGECNKILKAMKEGGFLPSENLQSKIAFQLSSGGKNDEASEFVDILEASGCAPGCKTWASLVEGHCAAGHLDTASDCFQNMVEKVGASSAGNALEVLVTTYCRKRSAVDAYKLFTDVITEKDLKPWHTTYKVLVSKLLVQRGFKEALSLLGLMKANGYPPFLDPFIEYVSKTGTTDDTVMFLKAMTVEKFPPSSVYLRVFEAYFKAGRQNEAQDFLSKCPKYVRNNADVLNLFHSMISAGEAGAPKALAA